MRNPARHPGPLVLAVVVALTFISGALEAQAPPTQGLFRLDHDLVCESQRPDLAALPDGGFVAVWVSEGRVGLRRFGSGFQSAGPDIRVDHGNSAPAAHVAVAAASDGTIAVAWSGDGLRVRVFDPSLSPRTEPLMLATARAGAELDLAATPNGGFVAAWQKGPDLWALTFDRQGRVGRRFEVIRAFEPPQETVRHPAVAVLADGNLVVAANYNKVGFPFPFSSVLNQVFDLQGHPLGDLQWVNGEHPRVVALPRGGFIQVWRDRDSILLQRFEAGGQPLGPQVLVDQDESGVRDPSELYLLSGPDVALLPDGAPIVVWEDFPDHESLLPQLFVRQVNDSGGDLGPIQPVDFGTSVVGSDGAPRLVTLAGGDVVLAGRYVLPGLPVDPLPCGIDNGIFATLLDTGRLILSDRFAVVVEWEDSRSGNRGVGLRGPQTRDTGSFWFFEPDNLELIVKIVDGRTVNGHFWFFYGALTDVGYDITVTDRATGEKRQYENPPGHLASFGDVTAFRAAESALEGGLAGASFASSVTVPSGVLALPAEPLSSIDSAAGPCSPPELPVVPRPGLCLADRRFEVEVEWRDPRSGKTGVGRQIPVNEITGGFWFFHPDNVELVVKVLDARAVNGRFWVLYGSLTDVEYTLRVRHAETGDEVIFENPPFHFGSGADTTSLVPPQCNCPLVPPDPVCGLDGVTYSDACSALCTGWVGVAHPGPCETTGGS